MRLSETFCSLYWSLFARSPLSGKMSAFKRSLTHSKVAGPTARRGSLSAIDQARLFELGDRAKEAACATVGSSAMSGVDRKMLWHIGGDLFDKGKFREASSWCE